MMSSELTRSGVLVWGGEIVVVRELYLRCSSWWAAENHKKGSCAVRVGKLLCYGNEAIILQLPCFEATYRGFHGFQPMSFALSEGVS